jgi:hypothetical protein
MLIKFKLNGVTQEVEIEDSLVALLFGARQHQAPPAQAASGRAERPLDPEVGPVYIVGMETSTKKRDGSPMASPKTTVKFDNGKAHSTFKEDVAGSAKTLWTQNKKVYYQTERNGEYQNLASVRSAEGKP